MTGILWLPKPDGWVPLDTTMYPPISRGMMRFCIHYVLHVLPPIGEPTLTKHEFRP